MIERQIVIWVACLLLGASLFPAGLMAHGGVVEEDDLCIIKVNYLRAHFKIYQPRVSGHEQFCEDLPVASESVFVMEYIHDGLAEVPVDFRIIRDVTGKGRFARWEDVEAIGDLEAVTVFYRQPRIEPDVLAVVHEFEDEGDYIGTDINPEAGFLFSAEYAQAGKVLYGDSIESLRALDATIDLFINDSDHSADYEAAEYEVIRDKLSDRAVLVGDNSHGSDRLLEFSLQQKRDFVFFKEEPVNHWYGGAGIGISFRRDALQPE